MTGLQISFTKLEIMTTLFELWESSLENKHEEINYIINFKYFKENISWNTSRQSFKIWKLELVKAFNPGTICKEKLCRSVYVRHYGTVISPVITFGEETTYLKNLEPLHTVQRIFEKFMREILHNLPEKNFLKKILFWG